MWVQQYVAPLFFDIFFFQSFLYDSQENSGDILPGILLPCFSDFRSSPVGFDEFLAAFRPVPVNFACFRKLKSLTWELILLKFLQSVQIDLFILANLLYLFRQLLWELLLVQYYPMVL